MTKNGSIYSYKYIISKEEILNKVSQEEIFKLVFKTNFPIREKIVSPFREDSNPGCWFSYQKNGILVFRDFGFHNKPIDCFLAIELYYNLSYIDSLEFIYNSLIKGKSNISLKPKIAKKKQKNVERKRTEIAFYIRNFQIKDKKYWQQYGITKNQLISDFVYPVSKFIINRKKKIEAKKLTYSYAEFPKNVKLYSPFNKRFKFITNCVASDIGGLKSLKKKNELLIITKSYKDYRVLKNFNLDVIWVQSEAISLPINLLKKTFNEYEELLVFFDNDQKGREYSIKKIETLENLGYTTREIFLLGKEKDPSDFYKNHGKDKLKNFLIENNIINYEKYSSSFMESDQEAPF